MRPTWRFRVLLIGSLLVTTLNGGRVVANGHFGHGRYLAPTAYDVAVPTSYVVPTVYVSPTTYVDYAPTSYVATSYVMRPSYSYVAPTAYTTPLLPASYSWARPTVYATATSYVVPTSYVLSPSAYVPTAYAVPSAGLGCDPCAAEPPCATSYASPQSTSITYTPSHSEKPAKSAPPPTVTSEARGSGETTPSDPTSRRESIPAPGTAKPSNVDPNFNSPPDAPAHERDAGGAGAGTGQGATPAMTPLGGGSERTTPTPAKPPVAPGGDVPPPVEIPQPGEASAVQRESLKPVFSPTSAGVRPASLTNTNVLYGRVVNGDDGRPEEGVRVTVANRLQTYADRVAVSGPSGRYSVRLPDGDWTVKVTMPSGKSYVVSNLIVDRGRIVDDQGRDIPSLTITR